MRRSATSIRSISRRSSATGSSALIRCTRRSPPAADRGRPLEEVLMRAYDAQLSIYFSADGSPRGCFAVGTATTEAVEDPETRSALVEGLRALDAYFAARLQEIGRAS